MSVVRDASTSTLLQRTATDGRLRTALGAAIAFGLAGVALQALTAPATLTTWRTSGAVQARLEQRILLETVPIRISTTSDLRSVRTDLLEKGHEPTAEDNYQVILETADGSWRMNLLGRREPVEKAVQTIHAFLDDPGRESLEVRLAPTSIFLVLHRVGLGILLFGLLYLVDVPLRIAKLWRT